MMGKVHARLIIKEDRLMGFTFLEYLKTRELHKEGKGVKQRDYWYSDLEY